jgi:NADPH-dependent 2,4-dienoyl-CoA reductase/sulfur reductase-like enzyme
LIAKLVKYDVVVVGGGAGGVAAALTLKHFRPELKVILIRKGKGQTISCSFPFVADVDTMLKEEGVDLAIDEVVEIDRARKLVRTASGKEFEYGKLVLATGAKPVKLNIPGIDLEGVFTASTEFDEIMSVHENLGKAKRVVIVGAGYIGMGFADELASGREVHVVEVLDEVLALALDREFGEIARRKLEERGVEFHLKASVEEIRGRGRVEEVALSTGEVLPADAVLVSVGVSPNSQLAAKAGLALDELGHVAVDSYMRTSDPDIYAVGDVAQKKDYFTSKPVRAYFSSIAVAEGRVAAMHIAGAAPAKGFEGAVPAFTAQLAGSFFAAAGLTEAAARRLGMNVVSATVDSVYSHSGFLEGGAPKLFKVLLKAVFTKGDYRLVGVQAMGPEAINELMSYAVSAIKQGLTAYDLASYPFASPPLWFRTPLTHPLQLAALKVLATA